MRIRSRDVASAGEEGRVLRMLECLRSAGLKATPQRVAIIRELADDPTHPTAQELFERLQPAMPTMSFATVYNTLDALLRAGLCSALSLSKGASRFDPNMSPHHHMVCDHCGFVRDVTLGEKIEEPPAGLAEGSGFKVRSVEKIFRGICASCARTEGTRAHAEEYS